MRMHERLRIIQINVELYYIEIYVILHIDATYSRKIYSLSLTIFHYETGNAQCQELMIMMMRHCIFNAAKSVLPP